MWEKFNIYKSRLFLKNNKINLPFKFYQIYLYTYTFFYKERNIINTEQLKQIRIIPNSSFPYSN